MADELTGDRTEPATPRKRQRSREEGIVARSQDLTNAVILLAAVVLLFFYGETLLGKTIDLLRDSLSRLHETKTDADSVESVVLEMLLVLLVLAGPLLAVVVVASLAVNLAQVGLVFTTKTLAFRFSRLNPLGGLQRIFGVRGLARLLAGLFKLAVIGVVLYFTLVGEIDHLFLLIDQEVRSIVAYTGGVMFRLAIRTAVALLVLAIFDYSFQRWQYERDLRMSKQEVKDELKTLEGDPKIRARRRQIQVQLARQRMMAGVPKADVIVTNPVFLAIAIRYSKEMRAPRVVAKGAGRVAERIRDLAATHRIPVVEKRELAQALFKACEVGADVPEDLWQAVAEILAYVYNLGKSPAML